MCAYAPVVVWWTGPNGIIAMFSPPTPLQHILPLIAYPPVAIIPMMLDAFSPRCAPLSATKQRLIVMFSRQMGAHSTSSAGASAHQDISHASRLLATQEG